MKRDKNWISLNDAERDEIEERRCHRNIGIAIVVVLLCGYGLLLAIEVYAVVQ